MSPPQDVGDQALLGQAGAGGGAIVVSSNVIIFGSNGATQTWNGTSWTDETAIANNRNAGNGSITDAIAINGLSGWDECQAWNGSSWASIDDTTTGTRDMGNSSGANSSDGLCVSGRTGGVTALTVRCEQRTTGNWSADTDIGTATMVSAGGGGYLNCIHTGGQAVGSSRRTGTALFNGSTWNNSGDDMATGRQQHCSDGTTSDAFVCGNDDYSLTTEVFNGSVWSSGGDSIIGRSDGVGAGTSTKAMAIAGYGGDPASSQVSTENYGGSGVWAVGTEVNENITMGSGGMGD